MPSSCPSSPRSASTCIEADHLLQAKAGSANANLTRGVAGKKDVGEAFFVFMGEFREEFKQKNPKNKSVTAVGKAAGERWKSLSKSIMMYQLCKGVAFCHGCGVRHHDLEPHNLVIGGWAGILWFDPSKKKCSLLFINQTHFLLSWMDGTPSI